MKIKFNKKIAIMASSIVLVESAIYAGFVGFTKKKPFSKNKYECHKVTLESNIDEFESEFYVSDEIGLQNAVIVKTPYKPDNKKKYECEIIAIPTSEFSSEKLESIKNNENLLNDSVILEKLDDINNSNNKLLSYDTVGSIPSDNDYKLYYSNIEEDFLDTKNLGDSAKDLKNTINYLLFAGSGALITLPTVKKLTKKKLK